MTELGIRTIPGYVVHERLENSAVDATYLASRMSDGYPVVLQLLTEASTSAAVATILRTAIDQVSTVRHPVIPTVWEVGEADGRLYTISNAVEGRSLAATLATQRLLAHDEMLAICTELADALEMLSAAGVVHGAVSPRTVWINDRHRAPSAPYVSLRGFGTAALLMDLRRTEPTRPPPLDLLCVAPEQVAGEQATERTDQYALACLTLHGLTGDPLFDCPTLEALCTAHASKVPDDADLHADALPRRIVDGLRRALAKDPAERFDSSAAFASAIGGTAHRSWSWMIEEAATREVATRDHAQPREIDLRDNGGPPEHRDAGGTFSDGAQPPHSSQDEGGPPPSDSERVTARSLADADWLPSPTGSGPPHPVGRPSAPLHPVGPGGVRELFAVGWRRWLAAAVVFVGVAAAAAAVASALLSPGSTTTGNTAAGPPTGGTVREIQATWRNPIADEPVTRIVAAEDELVGAAGNQVTNLDQDTGGQRWTTNVDGAVRGLTVMGPTVIVRTTNGFTGLDRTSGEPRWRATGTDLPDISAFVTSRGRMFGAGPSDDGSVAIHAIDPATGEIGWSVDTQDSVVGPGQVGIAYDGSERGERSLYVATGNQLYAFDTMTRDLRWQVPVNRPRPASLTAVGGAVLVIDGSGQLCRYNASDGSQAWTTCATLERTDAPVSMVQVRNSQVIVGGSHEIMSVGFTSGERQWRIVSEQQLQPAMASNRAAAFIAAPDGTVEALAQHNGASLWESAPFGEISAMAATGDAVFVTTSDGRLTRLEAPTAQN